MFHELIINRIQTIKFLRSNIVIVDQLLIETRLQKTRNFLNYVRRRKREKKKKTLAKRVRRERQKIDNEISTKKIVN